jgi:hypothetical protein
LDKCRWDERASDHFNKRAPETGALETGATENRGSRGLGEDEELDSDLYTRGCMREKEEPTTC